MFKHRILTTIGTCGIMVAGVVATASPSLTALAARVTNSYIPQVRVRLSGPRAVAYATTSGHYMVEYQFLMENAHGQWHIARGYERRHIASIPTGTTHVQVQALTRYEVVHHQWSVAARSPIETVNYRSLANTVAHKAVASLATMQAALHNPQELGELHWSSTDALAVQQALGGKSASASMTAQYALTFLYASLSNNVSVFNSPISDQQGNTQFLPWLPAVGFAPNNVSAIDLVKTIAVDNALVSLGQITYEYRVTYTTTSGAVLTQKFNTTLDPDHKNPAYLNLNTAGWMGNQ